ncbi:GspE/PulE family protein [Hippea jasoniae]|uniref:GspE/PulE family protein n=1 Tax=Hippea jasoniae TaxID=944479 RepID=UPI000557B5E2|nr:GspE/PulE family protein [Hippea jasoniae]
MAKPIGQLLKEHGFITEEHINYAIKVQQSLKKRLGDVLLDLGFVTDKEVAEVLAKQSGVEFIDIDNITPAVEALNAIPKAFAIQNNVLPILKEDSKLIVAIADPYDERIKTMVQRFAKGGVEFKIAAASSLAKKVERAYYLAENPVEKAINNAIENILKDREVSVENLINMIIEDAIDKGASDIHINPMKEVSLVSYRIDGVLHIFYSFPISAHSRLVSTVKVKSSMDIATTNIPQDGSMSYEFLHEKFDFRVSTVPTLYGENLVMRILGGAQRQISLTEIGFKKPQLEIIEKAINSPFGIILATGPTGAGKTTTLYALLRRVNTMEKNVLTIEDPVELKVPLVHQTSVNPRANLTFASAIRAFLRQDPDVILVGEIRDEETATLAIRAALTGHLVLSTLHTNDAIGAISRLKDLGIGDFLLSSSLVCVVAQRLLRRLCSFCKQEYELSREDKDYLGIDIDKAYKHKGCQHCNFTGYLGRIAAGEVLFVDKTVQEMIVEQAPISKIREYLEQNGMISMKASAALSVKDGITDIDEIKRVFGI